MLGRFASIVSARGDSIVGARCAGLVFELRGGGGGGGCGWVISGRRRMTVHEGVGFVGVNG